jgi:hypothetical protein
MRLSTLACPAALAWLGCGGDLMQAQPISDGGSQADDGGSQADDGGSPGTTANDGGLDGTQDTAGTTMVGTTDGETSAPDPTTSASGSSSASDSSGASDSSSTGPIRSGCRSDEDCERPTAVCDTGSGDCVVCLPGDDTCGPGTYCDPDLLDCMPGCDDDTDCDDQVCDTATQSCVDCVEDRDCPAGVCDETSNACVTLGYDCLGNSDNCNDGEQCCGANECAGACMIACGSVDDCPPTMGCEHGWCFFPCDNDDNDCAAWPGYSCQHGGMFCEAD